MRLINFSKVAVLTTVVFVLCIYVPAGAADPEGWAITQITYNDYDDTNPQISGLNVAWEGGGMIYFYDGTDVTWIEESFDGQQPQVSLNNVVWHFYDAAWKYEVSFYNGTLTKLLTYNDYHDQNPQISGNNVVWQSDVLGSNDTQIMLYDPDAMPQLKTLANPGYDNEVPLISGENVVWQAYYDPWPEPGVEGYKIFYYDGSIHQLTDNFSDYGPQISGNNVAWQGYGTSSTEIFYCEAPSGSIKQLTDNTVEDELPQISGSTVVWRSRVPDTPWPYLYDIYMCDTSETAPIPVKLGGSLDNDYPQVSGSNVVWQGRESDSSDWEIFFYDGAADEIIQLTDNAVDDSFPQISDTNVVWQGLVDDGLGTYHYQIFLAEKLSATEADIEVSPLTCDFGEVWVDVATTATVTISNEGNEDLTVTDIYLELGSLSDFTIRRKPNLPKVLKPDTSVELAIVYKPSSAVSSTDVLGIISDDPDEGLVEVSLSGMGILHRDIEVSPLMYDFGEVQIYESATTTVTISNVGNLLLTIDAIDFQEGSSEDFSIDPEIDPNDLPIVLRTHGPKASVEIDIKFSPLDIGPKSAVLEIHSNDPDEDPTSISFFGNGIQ